MSFMLASLYLPRDETALINWSLLSYKVIFQEMEPEYNLEIKTFIKWRQWATKTLKQLLQTKNKKKKRCHLRLHIYVVL